MQLANPIDTANARVFVAAVHGLMASAEAMSHAAKWIEADYPGIHVRRPTKLEAGQ